jgi:hypothetical protein
MSARNFSIFRAGNYGIVDILHDHGILTVMLHGSPVVVYNEGSDTLTLRHNGWCTRTTRMAINTALSQLPDYKHYRVFIDAGQMILMEGDSIRIPFEDGMKISGGPNKLEL